jgi:ABC-type amino acid transport substrate-binding protein
LLNQIKSLLLKNNQMNIKHFFVAFISIAMLSCGTNPPPPPPTPVANEPLSLLDSINKAGELKVGFEPDAPPLYFEESGKKQGFDYDLINYLSKEVFDGVKITSVEDGYDNLPDLLNKGKIDIMAGGRTNDEKGEELYSDSYLSFGYCIVTKSGNAKKYQTLESISKAKIGVYDQYTAQWVKEKAPSANVVIIGDREDENTAESDWMGGLVKGEFDVVVYDYPFATNEIKDYDKLAITSKNLNGDELSEYVLVVNSKANGARELVEKINDAIKKYKGTATYSDAVVQYIPSAVDNSKVSASADMYIVKKGETLSIIAKHHLGDYQKWKDIYDLNKDQLASPDIIYPGQAIVKPEGWQ